jgi:hypothetical protein
MGERDIPAFRICPWLWQNEGQVVGDETFPVLCVASNNFFLLLTTTQRIFWVREGYTALNHVCVYLTES